MERLVLLPVLVRLGGDSVVTGVQHSMITNTKLVRLDLGSGGAVSPVGFTSHGRDVVFRINLVQKELSINRGNQVVTAVEKVFAIISEEPRTQAIRSTQRGIGQVLIAVLTSGFPENHSDASSGKPVTSSKDLKTLLSPHDVELMVFTEVDLFKIIVYRNFKVKNTQVKVKTPAIFQASRMLITMRVPNFLSKNGERTITNLVVKLAVIVTIEASYEQGTETVTTVTQVFFIAEDGGFYGLSMRVLKAVSTVRFSSLMV